LTGTAQGLPKPEFHLPLGAFALGCRSSALRIQQGIFRSAASSDVTRSTSCLQGRNGGIS